MPAVFPGERVHPPLAGIIQAKSFQKAGERGTLLSADPLRYILPHPRPGFGWRELPHRAMWSSLRAHTGQIF